MAGYIHSKVVRSLWKTWQFTNKRVLREFETAIRHPDLAQELVFQGLLRNLHGTRFGREYGISKSTNLQEYRSRVPVQRPDSLTNWVNEIQGGANRVLCNDKVERLVPTSGTTGPRKLIPMTRSGRRDYANAVDLWIGRSAELFPESMMGSAYIATSPSLETNYTSAKVPVGFARDSDYVSWIGRIALAGILVVPGNASGWDPERWRNQTRKRLWEAGDLRLLSIWHPSYISALFSPEEISQLPRRWPNLKLISCWADGACRQPAKALAEHFPGAELQPKGLWLTEGVVSIPWGDIQLAAVSTTFLEFESADGAVILVHEMEEGEVYRPVISNRFGLYRYLTGDLVRVVRFEMQTPVLEWIGRADRVSDLCGEKLSEGQVTLALESAGCREFALVLPVNGNRTRHYQIVICGASAFDKAVLEREFMKNPHYFWARKIGQLAPVEVTIVSRNTAQVIEQTLASHQAMHRKAERLLINPQLIDAILGILDLESGPACHA